RKPFFGKKGFSLSPRPLSLSKKTLAAAALNGTVSAQHIKTADSKVTSLLYLLVVYKLSGKSRQLRVQGLPCRQARGGVSPETVC
ncbi:MAG: hypothetical protein J6O50_11490, partial [Ruminiclostridium sp.]|nr:hypothetical protein [Ruminiclostridium sp.]